MVEAIWFRLRAARVSLLAAGLSYYVMASLLPLLVLGSGVLGLISRRDSDVAPRIVEWLGVEGHAAVLVEDSIAHAERAHVASSLVGIAGLVWAALAVTGALRRAVDAVWGVADVGWTARLRSIPWAIVTAVLIAGSLSASGFATSVEGVGGVLAGGVGVLSTAVMAGWFLSRLGSCEPDRRALLIATLFLTIGLEVVKNSAVFVVPRLVSRASALYGGLGAGVTALVGVLVGSWLLLIATAIAAELSLTRPTLEHADGSEDLPV
ncbi:MAG: YihY/virulence factor BrkB family protein [Actinomycetia bacterium]|nr:YihY/virulence factor BrkB family protein [Actinomycetes bacterium]MCP4959920.1 YihY/virulence factor BrkB family protein [Actinomycetes bacterium]